MRSVLAGLVATALGIWALWSTTDGARAFTTEGARRLAISEQPREVPDVRLQDRSGNYFHLSDLRGNVVVVDFIYTRCLTFCTTLGNSLQAMQSQLAGDERDIILLSISFDPERDTPKYLSAYGRRFKADPDRWRITRITEPEQLPQLLDAFGITVIPDGHGGFEHNAAVHVVDRQGRLTHISDYDDPDAALQALRTYL